MSDVEVRDAGLPLLASPEARVESLLFASGRPLSLNEMAALLPEGTDLEGILRRLEGFWSGRGVVLSRSAAGYRLKARAELVPETDSQKSTRRLSEGAVATLSVIAMHQPITVPQIETVRRVKLARGIVESLEDAGLIEAYERRRGTGRAIRYVTTDKFLLLTGLSALSDMPTPEEVLHTEIVGD